MKLTELYSGADLYRDNKILTISFSKPHCAVSTSAVNGGFLSSVTDICNCQVAEAYKHEGYFEDNPAITELALFFAEKAHVPPGSSVFLLTAANMKNAVWKIKHYRELIVTAVCTAGALSNAVRSGDPGSYYEDNGSFIPLGTINIIIAVNKPLSPGAMCKAVITATEAKTAVLQELQVPSRSSPRLATGTGTDQIVIASQISDTKPISDTGTHSKCGELIASVSAEAVTAALELQDGITPLQRGYLPAMLGRFGIDSKDIVDGINRYLDGDMKEVLTNNFESIQRDCSITAAVSSLIHSFDLAEWGIVASSCRTEGLVSAAAVLLCSTAGNYSCMEEAISLIRSHFPNTITSKTILPVVFEAIAAGLKKRWEK